jgi:hypothetical protein
MYKKRNKGGVSMKRNTNQNQADPKAKKRIEQTD